MIFGGLLGVWLVLCGAGSVWFARSDAPASPAIIGVFSAASIAVAYVFSTLWWMNFGPLSFGILIWLALILITANFVFLNRSPKQVELSLGTLLLAGFCVAALLWVLKADSRQHFGFDTWDAVVSWNRWANELLIGRYAPYPNPYPILWPTLWSVIYAAQGAEPWQVLSKNLHLILIVLASLVSWELWRRRKAAAALVFAGGLLLGTGEILHKFTWGYMDQPVALLIAAGVASLFLTKDESKTTSEDRLIWLLPFFLFGIAAVTKQAGWPLVVLGLIVAAYDYFNGRIDWKNLFLAISGLVIPVLVFAVFFSGYQHAVMGTGSQIEGLISLSARRTEIDDIWSRGLALFLSVDNLADFVRLASLGLMTIAIFFLRGRERLIVALIALVAIAGSIGTGICCSYDDRNSGWLFSLSVAGLAGATASKNWPDRLKQTGLWRPVSASFETWKTRLLKTRWSLDRRVFAVFIPFALVSAAVIETGSRDYILASENVMNNLGGHVGANALRADIERTEGCRTIFSAHDMVRQNPIVAAYKADFKGGRDLKWYLRSGKAIDPNCQTYWYFKPGLLPQAAQEDKELLTRLIQDGQVIQLGGYAYRVRPGASW
ncbi:MAG: hypothetical protein ACE37M_13875 [Henriciella sp.]